MNPMPDDDDDVYDYAPILNPPTLRGPRQAARALPAAQETLWLRKRCFCVC